MKKYLLAGGLFLTLILSGCANNNKIVFNIYNGNDQEMKNVEITASPEVCRGQNFAEKILPKNSTTLILDFSRNKNDECIYPKGDGNYILTYEIGNQKFKKEFGYFTNGLPLDKEFNIDITADGKEYLFSNKINSNLRNNQVAKKIIKDYLTKTYSLKSQVNITFLEKMECTNSGCYFAMYEYSDPKTDEIIKGKIKLENWKIREIKDENAEDKVLTFLEKYFANQFDEKKAFCDYSVLDKQENQLYLDVLCLGFYKQDKKIICPNKKSRLECAMSKNPAKKECYDLCDVQKTKPYLVRGSGIGAPVKLTTKNREFSLWMPRDGSYYTQDLKANFTPKAFEKVHQNSINSSKNIYPRAEKHFGVKITFNIAETLNKSCEKVEDCGVLPPNYAVRSKKRFELKCEKNKCLIGNYNPHDHSEFPVLQK